ncbi:MULTISPECIES: DUF262 domain-containing protein [Bacillus]|uniref:DUF262 domain-containing protein n=1 Tax=Bacillus TaxID=1386 RepID=UPI0009AC829A|nr:DUF262 domain-containing protein [Bacillus altitudinis]MCM3044066.1 DUF262 domain-containing HNH endonuclease family protein [Bacillus altitudinis]MCY7629628.1 DUF262 domain-containing HNH endonuclease family protein [Bacillus altitudinis]MDH3108093.1 DUF262 domain-containing HNH endonuclease family protein [Bacillus altitudinis]MDX2365909.1 DUF262 domain-containing HNH endonuclease family protein [Bacillus altitudinis]MEC1804450.1 DUF262 domain-containing HNH endonuclease family protein [B
MATTIEVNKQSVKQLLETGKVNKFIIPEYQRPYAWSAEQIQTLFDDLVEYTKNGSESTYFLGTIVSFQNENNEQEIIDGQQRITSLFLLLRALYSKLDSMAQMKEVENFKRQIESALWEQDELTAEVNFKKPLFESRVIRDEGNKTFFSILADGMIEEDARDNYSLNYRLFLKLIDGFNLNEPLLFYKFILNVLNKAILLPITADSQDTALTIFSTLNDRGLALSDADIFKAKIYNHLDSEGKANFIEEWQQLEEDAGNAKESIQKLFYYYMFYLRALENDRNTTTPGIRKYYSRNNFEQLYKKELMDNLHTVANLWLVINNRVEIEGEDWSKNIEVKQALDGLSSYPNEFWKYPVVIYYLKYRCTKDFEEQFLKFLRKLLAVLASRYIVIPTINAVKRGILNLNAEIMRSSTPTFNFSPVDQQEFKTKIRTAHRNTVRMILKIIAYQKQKDLLPENWEIEHILPRKWQSSYFPINADREVKELVEHIGNKIPFEKKLNIIASNGYFKKKQESYEKTKVQILLDLSHQYTDWGIDQIRERDYRISDELWRILNDWGLNQLEFSMQGNQSHTLTE